MVDRMLKHSIKGAQSIFSTTHSYKWVSHYTTVAKTSRISNSMVEYLINSLGFSKDEAFTTCSKVSSFKSTVNPNSVIDFLKISGLSQTQIKILVAKLPKILSCNVDNTLKPKFQALQEVGFSGNDLAHIITIGPNICWRSLDYHIIPTLELLKSLFCNSSDDNNEVLINAVKKEPRLLGPNALKGLPYVISLLQSYGLSADQIKRLSIKRTRYLSLGPKLLESVCIRVEKLGIPRGSPMFFHGVCALGCLTEANLELKREIYKSYGFNDANILTLTRKHPNALLISESKLRNCLDFFMNVVGYQPVEIASIPYVLSFCLEKRVIPRYTIWKGLEQKGIRKETKKREKNINVAFVTCLTWSEPQFFEKFVRPYKDQYPDLCSDYMKVARPVLKASE